MVTGKELLEDKIRKEIELMNREMSDFM